MSVLLRQPQVFEGVLPLLVQRDPLDCSVADRPHEGRARHHLDPITPPHMHGVGHHYEITGFDELVWLDPKGLPVPGEVLQGSSYLIKAEDAAHRTDCPRHVQLEARSHVFVKGIPVVAVDRVESGSHDLHVLLRHRPPSIAQAQESA